MSGSHSSVGSSPRVGSFSVPSLANGSNSSNTSYASSVDGAAYSGLKTPSPEQAQHSDHSTSGAYPAATSTSQPLGSAYHYNSELYSSMNQAQSYMDVSQSHMTNSHGSVSAPGPPTSLPHYSYGQPQALQPASHSYQPTSYGQYAYSNGIAPLSSGGHPVSASMGLQSVPQSLPLPTMAPSAPPGSAGGQQYPQSYDTTGQVAPHGMKPRVTATLWEDEGSLCFQVEANGVCVARREDNHMINGTKLLNVAGMTRGRRDGILKSEKTRHVVKIGPMHLKGVW